MNGITSVSRKTLAVAAAYSIGIVAPVYAGATPGPIAVSSLVTAVTIIFIAFREKPANFYAAAANKAAAVLFILMIFQAGFLRGAFLLSQKIAHDEKIVSMYGKTARFRGTVEDVRRDMTTGKLSLRVSIDYIFDRRDGSYLKFGAEGFVSVSSEKNEKNPAISPGDSITFSAGVVEPSVLNNPRVRRIDNPLRANKIFLRVKSPSSITFPARAGLFNVASNLKSCIKKTFAKFFPDDIEGFLNAFFLGDAGAAGDDIISAFREAGTLHALVISGGHITIFIQFITSLAGISGMGKKRRALIVFPPLTLYIISTGLQAASCRAYVSYLIIFAGRIFDRQTNKFQSLLSAFLIQTLLFPEFIFDAGFWLSYITTFMIFAVSGETDGERNPCNSGVTAIIKGSLIENLKVSFFALAGSYPLICYISGFYPAFSLPANVATLWIYELLLAAILIFLASGFASAALAGICAPSVYFLSLAAIKANDFFAALPRTNISPYAMSFMETVFLNALIIVSVIYISAGGIRSIRGLFDETNLKYSIIVIFLFSTFVIKSFIAYNSRGFEAAFLDVGQGDCAIVRSAHGKYVMIDAGGGTEGIYEKTILPFLRSSRICSIDYLIITHGHSDHYCAAQKLIEKSGIRIQNFVYSCESSAENEYNRLMISVNKMKINKIKPSAGDEINLDGMKITFLWPEIGQINSMTSENDRSIAFSLKYMNKSYFFTGDISSDVEKCIIKKFKIDDAFCLKSSHHGSKTSNSDDFVKATTPSMVFISSGKGNRYDHPSPDIVKKFVDAKSKIINSQIDGGVIVKFFNGKYVMENYAGTSTAL